MKLSPREAIEVLVLPILSAGVFILWDLNKGVSQLNVQVGVLIEISSVSDEKIKTLERRMERLEEKLNQGGSHDR